MTIIWSDQKIYNIYNYLNLNMKPEGIEIPKLRVDAENGPFADESVVFQPPI